MQQVGLLSKTVRNYFYTESQAWKQKPQTLRYAEKKEGYHISGKLNITLTANYKTQESQSHVH